MVFAVGACPNIGEYLYIQDVVLSASGELQVELLLASGETVMSMETGVWTAAIPREWEITSLTYTFLFD